MVINQPLNQTPQNDQKQDSQTEILGQQDGTSPGFDFDSLILNAEWETVEIGAGDIGQILNQQQSVASRPPKGEQMQVSGLSFGPETRVPERQTSTFATGGQTTRGISQTKRRTISQKDDEAVRRLQKLLGTMK